MKIRLGLISWATGTLVLAALSACSGGGSDSPPNPEPSSRSPEAPISSEAVPTDPADVASANASRAVRKYFRVVDELRSEPAAALNKLNSVATSTQLNAIETLIRQQRAEGQRQTGATAVLELQVQSLSLDNSAPGAGKVPTTVVDACWDVAMVDVLDERGESIVSPKRPDTGWTRFTVANHDYAADPSGGWRVVTGRDLKQAPCADS